MATINIKRQIPAHPKPPTCDVVKRTTYGVDVFDITVFSCLSQNLQHLICQRLTSWATLTWTTGKFCVDKTLWFTYLSQDSSLLKILRQQEIHQPTPKCLQHIRQSRSSQWFEKAFLKSHSNLQISFQFDTNTSCGISSVCALLHCRWCVSRCVCVCV